ncbi:alpha/beta hydrolase [Vulgatibacter sp.]|uniref:alpha/beta hydrolase n=1 Tax=Vulgatibacter sp. TaxID=1971226 RepID=UPI0035641328
MGRSGKPDAVPPASTDPYDIGEGPEAVLLLHGFSGSPWELHPLAEGLAAAGFRCKVPLLPGHGVDAHRLGETGEADWLAAAHDALDALLAEGRRRVFLAGFSAGGALAIRIAAERPGDLAALALLAPALGFHGNARLYRGLFRHRLLSRLYPYVGKGSMDVRDPVMKRDAPYLARLPTAAAAHLDRVVRGAREALPQVRTPALVLWGAQDAVVPRSAAEEAAKRIGSGPARLAVFPQSAHQLALDVERQAVATEVVRFFSVFVRPETGAPA